MKVRIVDPRTDPEPPGLAEFTTRHQLPPVWDFALLRLEAWLAGNRPVLALVADAGRVVAAVAAVVCVPRGVRRFAPQRRRGPAWVEVRLSWLSGSPAFVFDTANVNERRDILRAVESALRAYLGRGFLGLVYRAVGPEALPLVDGRGRVVRNIEANAVLPNTWPDVDGWLGTLSRERRKSIRRYAKVIARDPTLHVEHGAGRADVEPAELTALLNEHNDRLGVPAFSHRTKMATAYLGALIRRPDVHTLTYRDSATGRLLAFNTLLDHPRTAVLHQWATLPVTAGGRYNLYFDCYLHCVRHMIEHGRAELHAGRGLLDVKTSLGFAVRQRYAVVAPMPVTGR